MGNKPLIFVLLLFIFLGFALPAPADDAGKLPMISGAKEKPCGEEEKGTCLETPKKRFEVTSSADIGSVVKDLILSSKKRDGRCSRSPVVETLVTRVGIQWASR